MYRLLKVGSDCEVFLKDPFGNSVPVIGLLGGTKQNPKPVLGGKGFAVQEDNVMAEFNIPAANDITSFVTSINKITCYLDDYFNELVHDKHRFLSVDISPSCLFSPRQLDHPQAKEIGCEPDMCVWTRKENKITSAHPLLKQMRTAGGHLHVSYTYDGKSPAEFEDEVTENFIKMHDLCHGVPSVILDRDTRRKQLYGKAGAFRFKDYGAAAGHEYRVLSNFWIKGLNTIRWAYRQTEHCIELLNADSISFDENELGKRIQTCINTNNVEMAQEICQEYGIEY